MSSVNRQQRKAIDKQAQKSIDAIKSHLNFLNEAGNPKYKLVKQSTLGYKIKRAARKLAFWS